MKLSRSFYGSANKGSGKQSDRKALTECSAWYLEWRRTAKSTPARVQLLWVSSDRTILLRLQPRISTISWPFQRFLDATSTLGAI